MLEQSISQKKVDQQKKQFGLDIYLRLLRYTFVYWKIFALAIIGMVIIALSSTAFTALMKPLMDGSFVHRDPTTIKWVPLALIGIYLIRTLGAFAATYGMSLIGRNVIYILRNEMLDKLLSMPKYFYDRSTTGELMSKFTYDVEQVAHASTHAVTVFIRDTLTIIGLLSWMIYLNALLSLLFIVVMPVVTLLIVWVSKRFRRISQHIQGSMGDVSRVLEEAIKGNQVVKIFGGQQYEKQQFDQVNSLNRHQNLKMQMTTALSQPIVQLIVACALAVLIYLATLPGMIEKITVGTFMSFLAAIFMLMPSVKAITAVVSDLQRGIAAAQSIFDFIDLEKEKDTGQYEANRVKGELAFKQLNFKYQRAKKNALENINFTINAGQTVAIVGRSGSGKSTLLNLIPRLYEIEEGEITLDGHNIQDYTLQNLRSHISYVGQDVVLFNDTIKHNIAYGQMKDASQAQIEAAAKAAYATDFISKSADGFDTMVGERGVMLSGGQRQRIAIARALLKNAPVLILDEATSSLDTESERYIQASLENLMKNRTTLVIAHRLSTIENADIIMVMDQGRIVESGTHDELLVLNAHYASLHRIQFKDASYQPPDEILV